MVQYVVFVDDSLLLGSVQTAVAGMAGRDDRGLAVSSIGLAEELDLRHSILSGLAATLTGEPGAAGGLLAMTDAITGLSDRAPAGHRRKKPIEGATVLEGVSALVVDDQAVDIASLANVVGLHVVPNIELRLPTPIVEAAAASNDWHLQKIGLASGAAGGSDVLVGVLDTGIDDTHPEFAGKTVHFAEFDAAGRNTTGPTRDAGEHGTHVSSTATGKTCGVAPDASLAVTAVLTNKDPFGRMSGSLVQIVNGFNWLVTTRFRGETPGVDVVNASLGGAGFNTYLQPAVRTARGLGIPLIAAIGNSGRSGVGQHGSPGNYPEALGVGASDAGDAVAEFSDWGVAPPPTGPTYPLPALCAPGVQVYAAKPGGGFQLMSGTSMATPVVTGVAARRMSANRTLVGKPAALFLDLLRTLAPWSPGLFGNQGGAGRIIA